MLHDKELVSLYFRGLWTYSTLCQASQSTQSEATQCTEEEWRPKTSSLYVVCWNAKCFLSSDASSTSRCLSPVHAAFGALPSSIETTWLNDRRRRQSDRWRRITVRVIGNETKHKTYSLNYLEPCQFVPETVWTKMHIASNASIILSILTLTIFLTFSYSQHAIQQP